ncbi:MAG: hypothetical protein WAO35_27620, partial [Terriglobia bacterium]
DPPPPAAVGTPPLQNADLNPAATTSDTTAKPFTQEQVVSMVRAGLGDDSGAKLIEQRGIDFAPSEDFMQTLKAAGASEAFLNALRAAKPPGDQRYRASGGTMLNAYVSGNQRSVLRRYR